MSNLRSAYSLAALVALATFALYLPALRNGFVTWDDGLYVYENLHIRSLSLPFFKWAFFESQVILWHPLTWMSHALDYAMWGLNPAGHHLTSIVFHGFNTVLVFLLVVRLFESGVDAGTDHAGHLKLASATITAFLFGLHPLHVESVAWVTERKDVLSALFYLLSLLAYLRHLRTSTHADRRGTAGFLNRRYLTCLGLFVLALLSKPMAVTLPLVMLIIDWYPLGRFGGGERPIAVILEKLPFFLFSLLMVIITLTLNIYDSLLRIADLQPLTTILVGCRALVFYMSKMIWPSELVPLYPYMHDVAFLSPKYIISFLSVITLTGGCFFLSKKWRILPAVWEYCIVTPLPVIGMYRIAPQVMADRYTYLPSLGPFLLMGLVAAWCWEKTDSPGKYGLILKRSMVAVAIAVVIAVSYATVKQISIWKGGMDFWNSIIEKEPNRVPFAYNNRGLAFKELGWLDRALEDFDTAIRLDPRYANAYTSRGWTFKDMGQIDRAMEDYNHVISLDPARYIAYNNRGMVYQETGRIDSALSDFTTAIALNPGFAQAYTNRGMAFEQAGRTDLALEDYTSAINVNPSFANAYNNRGLIFERAGRLDQALEDFNAAIWLDPSGVEAYNNRGLVFEDLNQFDRAVEDYGRAVGLHPDDYLSYSNRGIALGKMGLFDQAIEDHTKAITLKPDFA